MHFVLKNFRARPCGCKARFVVSLPISPSSHFSEENLLTGTSCHSKGLAKFSNVMWWVGGEKKKSWEEDKRKADNDTVQSLNKENSILLLMLSFWTVSRGKMGIQTKLI